MHILHLLLTILHLRKNIKNKGVGALQPSSTFFSHVEAEMLKTLFFHICSSLEGIFKASFCTAWANSKFRKFVFVEAETLILFPRWNKSLKLVF